MWSATAALIGADDEGTLAHLNAHHNTLVNPKIEEHHGRIVRTTGDGLLVLFVSVMDALRCAVEVQRGMVERNAEVPPEARRLAIRKSRAIPGSAFSFRPKR
jgi:adenylate cyclase